MRGQGLRRQSMQGSKWSKKVCWGTVSPKTIIFNSLQKNLFENWERRILDPIKYLRWSLLQKQSTTCNRSLFSQSSILYVWHGFEYASPLEVFSHHFAMPQTPWVQKVNWTYVRRSEHAQDVSWCFEDI